MVVACQWLMDRDKTFLFLNMSDRRQGWREVWNQPSEERVQVRWIDGKSTDLGFISFRNMSSPWSSKVVRRRRQARGGGPVSSVVAMHGALSENVPHGLIVWGLGPQLVVLSVDPLGDRSFLEEIHHLGAFTASPHLLFPLYASCVQMNVLSQLTTLVTMYSFFLQCALVIVFDNSNYYSTQVLRTWF